jgi:GAF domain-containing protein
VFDAIVKRAMRLISGHSAVVLRFAEGMLQLAAFTSTGKSGDAVLRKSYPRPLAAHPRIARVIRSRKPYVISDTEKVSAGFERTRKIARARGYRSVLDVPLLRRGEVIGTLTVTRKQVSAFTKRQINLLQTFAAQAVTAIENARLFNETKEALERQTATAEILKVIASSPTDVQPVFDVIVERAVKLCGARFGRVYRYDGSMIQMVAGHGLSTSGLQQVQRVFPRRRPTTLSLGT